MRRVPYNTLFMDLLRAGEIHGDPFDYPDYDHDGDDDAPKEKTMTMKLATTPRPSRMLANVTRGKVDRPPRVVIFGPEGCGKTTWAAKAPNPVFLCAEDGTSQMDVARLPEPRCWDDVLAAVHELTVEEHDFQTLVIDSLDWLEPLCWDFICQRDGKAHIEDYGFMKGQKVIAPNEWRILLARLEDMCRKKRMGVILVAHSLVRTFKSPDSEDFGRYEMAMEQTAAGMMKQWADATLFARFETFADKDKKTKRVRGISTGARVMHTNRTAAFDAKNRFDLPDTMPLDWDLFMEAVKAHRPADPSVLLARIERLLEGVDDGLAALVRETVAKAGDNAAQLAKIADRLTARIQIAQQESGQ